MSLLEDLNWRYAVKKFDATKKISAEKLDQLLATVRLAPSSYGLQHYEILVIKDAVVRAKLREASYGQSQITDASQVIVFAAETNINEDYVANYINEIVKVRNIPAESMEGFKQYILGATSNIPAEQKIVWAQKQAYIALGVLIAAASELKIDTCPMEGFNAQEYDEILGLKEKGLTASVIVTIGYRAEDDLTGTFTKVRKPNSDLFIHV